MPFNFEFGEMMMFDLCRFFKPLNGVLVGLMLACAAPAWADDKTQLQQGVTAYEAGNYAQAFRLWQPFAQQGNAGAQYNLGVMYAKGRGVVQDDKQAVSWFQKAANQGDAKAQYNLGTMYLEGRGVARNDKQALAWLQKAAQHGHIKAQNNLGMMYANGWGVAQDDKQAVAWFQKAANQGLAAAQNNLGTMYAHGRGVAQDYQQAKAWWQKVLAQPDTADNAEAKVAARAGLQQLRNMGIR
nr:tetratricopeptide repeat protein [uncultured Kingella sp.]